MSERPTLHSIEPEQAGPVPEVVQLLEEVLVRAKAGEIIGVGLGLVLTRGCSQTGYALGEAYVTDLHYAAADLTRRLLVHEED